MHIYHLLRWIDMRKDSKSLKHYNYACISIALIAIKLTFNKMHIDVIFISDLDLYVLM